MSKDCCTCTSYKLRIEVLESKLDAIEFFFSRHVDEDVELCSIAGIAYEEDLNTQNLLKQLSLLNSMRGVK